MQQPDDVPLTPMVVDCVTFDRAPLGRRGYHEDQVDDFLDRVQATLSGTDTLTAQDVRDVMFDSAPLIRRGYHEDQVDDFLDLVEAELERRAHRRPPQPRPSPAERTNPMLWAVAPSMRTPPLHGSPEAQAAAARAAMDATANTNGSPDTAATPEIAPPNKPTAGPAQPAHTVAPQAQAPTPTPSPGPDTGTSATAQPSPAAPGQTRQPAARPSPTPGSPNTAPTAGQASPDRTDSTGQPATKHAGNPPAEGATTKPITNGPADAPQPSAAQTDRPTSIEPTVTQAKDGQPEQTTSTQADRELPEQAPSDQPGSGPATGQVAIEPETEHSETGQASGEQLTDGPPPSQPKPGPPVNAPSTGQANTAPATGRTDTGPTTPQASSHLATPAAAPSPTQASGQHTTPATADRTDQASTPATAQPSPGPAPHQAHTVPATSQTDTGPTPPTGTAPTATSQTPQGAAVTQNLMDAWRDTNLLALPLPPAPPGERGYRPGDIERLMTLLAEAITNPDGPRSDEIAGLKLSRTFFIGQGYHAGAVEALRLAWVTELRRREL